MSDDLRDNAWIPTDPGGWFELALLLIGAALFLYTVNPTIGSDGLARYEAIKALADAHIAPSKYSIIQPLLAQPLYVLGSKLGDAQIAVSYFNAVVTVIGVGGVVVLLPGAFGRRAAIFALAASMVPAHAQNFFGEPLTAFATLIGVLLLRQRNLWFGAVLVGIGGANSPGAMPAITLALVALAMLERSPLIAAAALPPWLLFCIENALKFGRLTGGDYLTAAEHGFKTLMPYSGLPGFSYPLMFGLLALVLSFGKGLVFFTPAIFLPRPLMKLDRTLAIVLLVLTAGLLVTYARWWAWYGGVYWGPRFFLLVSIAAAFVLAAATLRPYTSLTGRFMVGLSLVLSCWVCINGYTYGLGDMGPCLADNYALEHLCWYVPEFSPLWRPFVSGYVLSSAGRQYFAFWCAIVCLWYITDTLGLRRLSVQQLSDRLRA